MIEQFTKNIRNYCIGVHEGLRSIVPGQDKYSIKSNFNSNSFYARREDESAADDFKLRLRFDIIEDTCIVVFEYICFEDIFKDAGNDTRLFEYCADMARVHGFGVLVESAYEPMQGIFYKYLSKQMINIKEVSITPSKVDAYTKVMLLLFDVEDKPGRG